MLMSIIVHSQMSSNLHSRIQPHPHFIWLLSSSTGKPQTDAMYESTQKSIHHQRWWNCIKKFIPFCANLVMISNVWSPRLCYGQMRHNLQILEMRHSGPSVSILAINQSTQGVAPQHLHAIMLHIYQRFVDIAKIYGNVVLIGLHSYQMTFRTSTVHFMGRPQQVRCILTANVNWCMRYGASCSTKSSWMHTRMALWCVVEMGSRAVSFHGFSPIQLTTLRSGSSLLVVF